MIYRQVKLQADETEMEHGHIASEDENVTAIGPLELLQLLFLCPLAPGASINSAFIPAPLARGRAAMASPAIFFRPDC
jgi:hypothetical protein